MEEFIKSSSLDNRHKKLLEVANYYKQFPQITNFFEDFNRILRKEDRGLKFSIEISRTLSSLKGAIDILELSLENQERYNLVDKRWMRDTNTIRDALEKGRLVMELDIRLDEEGEFWVSHAVGANYTFFPPFVHKMSSAEGSLTSLGTKTIDNFLKNSYTKAFF